MQKAFKHRFYPTPQQDALLKLRIHPEKTVIKTVIKYSRMGWPGLWDRRDRDQNAAISILAVGQTVLACGATVRPNVSNTEGRCDEAGRNNRRNNRSDAVKTKKRLKSS